MKRDSRHGTKQRMVAKSRPEMVGFLLPGQAGLEKEGIACRYGLLGYFVLLYAGSNCSFTCW